MFYLFHLCSSHRRLACQGTSSPHLHGFWALQCWSESLSRNFQHSYRHQLESASQCILAIHTQQQNEVDYLMKNPSIANQNLVTRAAKPSSNDHFSQPLSMQSFWTCHLLELLLYCRGATRKAHSFLWQLPKLEAAFFLYRHLNWPWLQTWWVLVWF